MKTPSYVRRIRTHTDIQNIQSSQLFSSSSKDTRTHASKKWPINRTIRASLGAYYFSIFLSHIHRCGWSRYSERAYGSCRVALTDRIRRRGGQVRVYESERIYHVHLRGSHSHWERLLAPGEAFLTHCAVDSVTFLTWLDDLVRSRRSFFSHISEPLRGSMSAQDGIYRMYRNTSHGQLSFLGMEEEELLRRYWLSDGLEVEMT